MGMGEGHGAGEPDDIAVGAVAYGHKYGAVRALVRRAPAVRSDKYAGGCGLRHRSPQHRVGLLVRVGVVHMSRQRNDKTVARDAQRFNETYRALKRCLWRQGIRNPHTSQKAQAAIRRAAVRQVTL